ncbi:connectin-like [Anastrepha ludens]|uniref:connectin-like n=1 Tax=Anastrepha ludens TaxID=28586 RepID=UPI0023B1D825|nr:connectin-like [Anastrepha ludens]
MVAKHDVMLRKYSCWVTDCCAGGQMLEQATAKPNTKKCTNNAASMCESSESENNFVCDCRLRWIFELKNRTRFMQLRDMLEDFVCTLHDPKISNFIEPIPNHILDLLNIGSSYNGENLGGSNIGRKRFSKSRQSGTQRKVSGSGSNGQHFEQMQLTADNVEAGESNAAAIASIPENSAHILTLSKRSIAAKEEVVAAASSQSEMYNDAILAASDIPIVATANIIGEKKKKSISSVNLRDDYYDETTGVGGNPAQQVELGDGLDAFKQNALYNQQTNDVIGMTSSNTEHTASIKPQPLGIKVRLFTLKPEYLPCHDELSDPTELPLSRDLMDVRSNQAQSNMSSGGYGLTMATRTFGGVVALILRFSSRRRIG